MTSLVVRIRRAGSSPFRQPAGDSGIGHQRSRQRQAILHNRQGLASAETGYPCEGLGDLGCSEAPSSGLASPWEAFSRRAAMPRQSFLGIHFVFRKFQKSNRRNFQRGLPALSNLWEFWNADKWAEQHGYDCSYALARESPPVTLREGALKKGSWLVQGFAYTFVCNSAGSGPSDPMSALEGSPGCMENVRGSCAISPGFSLVFDGT